jgi:quinoprotein glucose dehydrogenase
MRAAFGVAIVLFGLSVPSDQQQQPPADPPSTPVRGNTPGEWRAINGDASSTRFAPLSQIDASNFGRLTVAWQWKGADSPVDLGGDTLPRNLPIYARGKLITTAGPTRTVVAMDPATGKTLWTFQEPATFRRTYSPRFNHG